MEAINKSVGNNKSVFGSLKNAVRLNISIINLLILVIILLLGLPS